MSLERLMALLERVRVNPMPAELHDKPKCERCNDTGWLDVVARPKMFQRCPEEIHNEKPAKVGVQDQVFS